MTGVVMLDLDAGPGFVRALQQVWEAGDAAFPFDRRLPSPAARQVIELVGPTAVIESDGERRGLDGGRPVEPGDALVVATSGTTGMPKAVIHTHDSVAASARATSARVGIEATDRWLACLPVAHIGGLSVITRALLTGTGLVVHDRFDPDATMAAAVEGATLVSLVTRALAQVDPAAFRAILLGGAAPPPDRPANAIATYGMTETGSGCVYDGYPLDGVELATADTGEVLVRSPVLLRAYRSADGDADPKTGDGWFATGDLGRLEPDGRLWIDGRAAELIITGGENVWPHRAETRLTAHPAIAEALVSGEPDLQWGQRVLAAVVPAPGVAPPSLDELRDWVKAELPAWYAPTVVRAVKALPRTRSGKLKR